MNNIKIYDNFLEQKDFYEIKNLLLCHRFPWFYNDYVDYNPDYMKVNSIEDQPNNFQFTHFFHSHFQFSSESAYILIPLLEKLNPSAIIRIKANLLTRTESPIHNNFHVDHDFKNATTAILYVNSNNGKTIFETGEEIESIENRVVVFNSAIRHKGTTCTDQKVRCVVNLNYYD